jgi:hypothetical protein
MRSRRFKISLITALIVVIIGAAGFGIRLYRDFLYAMTDVYVMLPATTDLVIEHMKANNGDWPRSWEELHKTYSSLQEKNWRFRQVRWEEYPQRVGIDFTADPFELATRQERPDEAPLHVIWSRAHPSARSPVHPEERLLDYLKDHKRKSRVDDDQPQVPVARDHVR